MSFAEDKLGAWYAKEAAYLEEQLIHGEITQEEYKILIIELNIEYREQLL